MFLENEKYSIYQKKWIKYAIHMICWSMRPKQESSIAVWWSSSSDSIQKRYRNYVCCFTLKFKHFFHFNLLHHVVFRCSSKWMYHIHIYKPNIIYRQQSFEWNVVESSSPSPSSLLIDNWNETIKKNHPVLYTHIVYITEQNKSEIII